MARRERGCWGALLVGLLISGGCTDLGDGNGMQQNSSMQTGGTAGANAGMNGAGTAGMMSTPAGSGSAMPTGTSGSGGMVPTGTAGSGGMPTGMGGASGSAGTMSTGAAGTMSTGAAGTMSTGTAGTTSMGTAGTMSDAGVTAGADAATPDAGPASSPFPSVSIDELTTSGGFTAATITGSGPGGAYNIYYPEELGHDGVKHPVLTWGNGAATTPDLYPLLPALASHGFVVIAETSPFPNGDLLRDGLDWMLEQNDVAGSEFAGMLDPDKVGAFGYSLGSLSTFEIGTDPRLKTTVHISGGIMGGADESQATAVDVPTAYFCDKDETGPNCDSDFAVVDDNPTFYGRVPGQVHVDYVFDAAFIDRMNTAVIAWLRWQLLDDQSMAVMFEGADCTLCTDPAWEVQKANMD